ncbi:MAG TPA: endonuclease/exonuclease/phosphatase family protein [Fimbriimonadaceae bacterium]|nr:endonuclease/exonuclease/phosphatase family protein [Fimbriimonadaceae bacterium]
MEPLRVMTFNVRYGTADDGPHAWPLRRWAALEAIRSFRPDLLGLQEALSFQIEEIAEVLPDHGRIGVGRDDGIDRGEHAAIFYDGSRLGVQDSGTFWFSDEPDTPGSRFSDCYHPRVCSWVRFAQGFACYNLHLDNESGPSRERSVAILLDRIRCDVPVLVVGDFNTGERDPCIQAMRDAGFRDSYRILHLEGEAATYHDFGRDGNPEKIDYIWIDGNWKALRASIERGQVWGAWPSDHYPVTAILTR